MATPPTHGWDVVAGTTLDVLQQAANTAYLTNKKFQQSWRAAPTLALNAKNQIVFTVLPYRYTGAYDVALDLAAVTVVPVPGTDPQKKVPSYQACFTSTPFSVTAAEGGDPDDAPSYADSLNQAVADKCLPFETRARQQDDGLPIGAQGQAILSGLTPQLMVFASLVDPEGAAVGQLLAPYMSTQAAPPSGDVFAAFSGDEALDVASQNAESNSVYALWDYFLLTNMVKPKLAQSFGIDESDITVSDTEPAVLTVGVPVTLAPEGNQDLDVTLSALTLQFTAEGIQVSADADVKKTTEIAGTAYGSEISGDLTVTLALSPDNSPDMPSIGLVVTSVSGSFDPEGLAQWVTVALVAKVYEALGDLTKALFLLVLFLVLVIVFILLLIVFAILSATGTDLATSIEDAIEKALNTKLAENRIPLSSALTVDSVVYDLGTVLFLTYSPGANAPAASTG